MKRTLISFILAFCFVPIASSEVCRAGDSSCLLNQSWMIAQRAIDSSADRALSTASLIDSAKSEELSVLLRERRRIVANIRLQSMNVSQGDSDTKRERMTELRSDLNRVDLGIEQLDPGFAELFTTRYVQVQEVQRALSSGELYLLIYTTQRGTFLFAVNRAEFKWIRLDVSASELARLRDEFRSQVTHENARGGAITLSSQPTKNNFSSAYAMYEHLLEPIEALLQKNKRLIISANGPLSDFPFYALLTKSPDTSSFIDKTRELDWLVKSHTVSIIPSPRALVELTDRRPSKAKKSFLGIGDPCIGGRISEHCESAELERGERASRPTERLSISGTFSRGTFNADARSLQSLSALPGTATELNAIANKFRHRADRSRLILGDSATESNIRSIDFSEYQIVSFATHALVADEIPGLPEPGIVLTPSEGNEANYDGLLTASEIAADLEFDADWVILSACNTSAGQGAGSEGLSGLANAFFYSGARALMVSYWDVDDIATSKLMSNTFSNYLDDGKATKSESLRASILDLLNSDEFDHPRYWSPFVVIGVD